ncbi:MAG: hypothetical protein ACKO3N_09895 [Verrucomicrobiota bacterium]
MTTSRRTFIRKSSLMAGGLALSSPGQWILPAAAETTAQLRVSDLPKGSAPEPLEFQHFPSRLHAFVWRNWPLVPTGRMAQVVGARPRDVQRLGRAMGLGEPPRIRPSQQERSYVTIIKRNWHLLLYEQLLALLGWSPERMAFTLREDDVLYWKLGTLKPECPPLRFTPADDACLRREQGIARIVRSEFLADAEQGGEPLFDFIAQLSAPPR